jgi:hypothetical protein
LSKISNRPFETAQAAKLKVERGEEIRDISKSHQRAKARRDRIQNLDQALEDFGDE